MTTQVRLGEICHARSGDKGDTANVGVLCYDLADYDWVRDQLTVEAVAAHMGRWVKGPVLRFELPSNGGLNFLLHGALGGGVSRTAMLDGHGKNYSAIILEMMIEDRRAVEAA